MSQSESRVLETSVGPATLAAIDAALERTWLAYPHVPHAIRMHMGIATAEIGANIVEHAVASRQICLAMDVAVLSDRIQVEFTDDGDELPAPVDLGSVRMPEAMAERGRGLALAQAVLDELTYRRTRLNHWTLVSKPFE
jgi:serine/threonine-protein kinase RsbW